MDDSKVGRGGTIIENDNHQEEVDTIVKMTPEIKSIFVKIREQLRDPSHPLVRICTKFQE